MTQPIIEVQNLSHQLGGEWVHQGLNLSVEANEIVAIVGGSGSGKTTLLRSLLMLHTPTSGSIRILDYDILRATEEEAYKLRRGFGVLFQQNALFSSLTVLENILFVFNEFTPLNSELQREMALLKISLVGLPLSAAYKYPSELSGGMQKRAALARAIALDPNLLFLDEPTSGLDPTSIKRFDEFIVELRNNLGLTILMITHEMATLRRVPDKVAFLGEGRVLAFGSLQEVMQETHPLIRTYFSSLQ